MTIVKPQDMSLAVLALAVCWLFAMAGLASGSECGPFAGHAKGNDLTLIWLHYV